MSLKGNGFCFSGGEIKGFLLRICFFMHQLVLRWFFCFACRYGVTFLRVGETPGYKLILFSKKSVLMQWSKIWPTVFYSCITMDILWYALCSFLSSMDEIYICSNETPNSFYAPLEKGGILFCNWRSECRSVGMSVSQSVDQVLSAQYLYELFTGTISNLVSSMSR